MPLPMRHRAALALPFHLLACSLAIAHAATADAPASTDQATRLPGVKVTARRHPPTPPDFPATQSGVTAEQVRATVNAVDVEDAAKYLPSVFIRKRNFGDTQPVLATRTWGVNSSARSLVYVDDIPISALIANNNTIGAPRWGVISPEQIDHIDMLYGPFSAAYPGNAMGGVMRIVTRMPEKTEVSIDQTEAVQSFDGYGTHGHYSSSQTSVTAGGRDGRLSWFLGANAQNSFSQPLAYLTSGSVPAGTSGAIPALNKSGQVANVLGAGGLLHTRMLNLDGHFAYDITSSLRATYLVGYWSNHGQSRAQTYLSDAGGQPTYGKTSGFASNIYQLRAHHLMQALSLKTDTRGAFDGSLVLTHYDFLKDRQQSPAGVLGGTEVSDDGRLADYGGTQWSTLDFSGVWRLQGYGGRQEISAGAHADRYELRNPTHTTASWMDPSSINGIYFLGRGRTTTKALWLQDAWQLAPHWLATLGGRYERWKADEGVNISGTTTVHQPGESASAFSPKLSLRWAVADSWHVTGSLARAMRFPTVGELYQLVSTGSVYAAPNPDLKPEQVRSGELAIEHALDEGSLQLSLFQENTRRALIAQTALLPGYALPATYTMNVGELRNRGIELAAQRSDVLAEGLDLSGSVTFVDSTILSNDSFASSTGTTSQGKHAPYVPRWRATAVATYRPTPDWSITLAGRYSGRQYSTLDNSDDMPHVFGAFDRFTVFDARVHYQISARLSASLGVDNVTNQKYYLYHPFQQRTFVADMRLSL